LGQADTDVATAAPGYPAGRNPAVPEC